LAIISFIFVGLMGVGSLIALIGALVTGFGPLMLMALVYVVLTVVMVFPGLYLIRYAMSIEKGLGSNSQTEFEIAIENLKSFFKFMGIYTIVVISLYIIMMIVGFSTAGSMMRF